MVTGLDSIGELPKATATATTSGCRKKTGTCNQVSGKAVKGSGKKTLPVGQKNEHRHVTLW
jgi:hypothetical protein